MKKEKSYLLLCTWSSNERLTARLRYFFDENRVSHFGQLRAEWAKSRSLIGSFGLMTARHARTFGLILVTNNMEQFE